MSPADQIVDWHTSARTFRCGSSRAEQGCCQVVPLVQWEPTPPTIIWFGTFKMRSGTPPPPARRPLRPWRRMRLNLPPNLCCPCPLSTMQGDPGAARGPACKWMPLFAPCHPASLVLVPCRFCCPVVIQVLLSPCHPASLAPVHHAGRSRSRTNLTPAAAAAAAQPAC